MIRQALRSLLRARASARIDPAMRRDACASLRTAPERYLHQAIGPDCVDLMVLLNLEPSFRRLLPMRVVTSLARPGDFCKCRLRSRLGSRGRLTQQLLCGHLYILRELYGVGGALLREEYLDLLEERL